MDPIKTLAKAVDRLIDPLVSKADKDATDAEEHARSGMHVHGIGPNPEREQSKAKAQAARASAEELKTLAEEIKRLAT